MKKIKTRKALRNQAWILMSEFVRRRDRGQCFTCYDRRDWKQQNAGHFVHKDCLDFDRRNVNCQCVRCNKWLSGNLAIYADRLLKKYGPGIVDELVQLGNQVKRFTREELEDVIADLKFRILALDK